MRRIVAILLALVVGGPVAQDRSSALPDSARVEAYATGLAFPVDMAWVPGTAKIFFTENATGKVRVMVGGKLLRRPCVNLDVDASGGRGLLGIVLHPRFATNHWLYVYFTNRDPLVNRVVRFTVRENRCRAARIIVNGLSTQGTTKHNGGQLDFVAGKLLVSTGDAGHPSNAQDAENRLGKILRVNPDGSIPKGNPFSERGDRNPVWSYGLRNPFGLAHEPGTRRVYATDNGPDCDDELNRIRKGRNYGWGPGYVCGTAGVGHHPQGPLRRWTPPIVPTDLWWYRGAMRSLSGSLYMGDFRGGLHRFFMNARGTRVRKHRVIHRSSEGILDVAKGPGGWLYFLTPSAIYRIVPS